MTERVATLAFMYAAPATSSGLGVREALGVAVTSLVIGGLFLYASAGLGILLARWVLRIIFPLMWAFLYSGEKHGPLEAFFGMATALISAIDLVTSGFDWKSLVMRTICVMVIGATLAAMYPDQKWISSVVTLVDSLF